MAYVTIPGGFYIPRPHPWRTNETTAFTTGQILTTTATKQTWVIQVPKTGTLSGVGLLLGTVTTPGDVRIAFQDVSLTTGLGDTVDDQFQVVAIAVAGWADFDTITSTGAGGGAKRSVTQGDLLAVVLSGNGTAVSVTPFLFSAAAGGQLHPFPYSWQSGGVGHDTAPFVLKYDDGTYGTMPGPPATAFNTGTFNSTSTPDERGLKFQLPITCKISGCYTRVDLDNDATLVLYDASNGVLSTQTFDKDVRTATTPGYHWLRLTSDVVITANTVYRLVWKPGASNISYYDYDINLAAYWDAYEGGQNFHHTQRTDAGAWTDTTTKRPWMGLLVTAIDDDSTPPTSIETAHVFIGS